MTHLRMLLQVVQHLTVRCDAEATVEVADSFVPEDARADSGCECRVRLFALELQNVGGGAFSAGVHRGLSGFCQTADDEHFNRLAGADDCGEAVLAVQKGAVICELN